MLDPISRAAAQAGAVHLRRALARLENALHDLSLAEACSDECAMRAVPVALAEAARAIRLRVGIIDALEESARARRHAVGIRARTWLPSPTYDHLFRLTERDGKTLCVMVPGTLQYDKHYAEEVPAPRLRLVAAED